MFAFFKLIISKVFAVVEWFSKLFVAIFEAIWDLVRDAACWPFEQIMIIVTEAVESFDFSAMENYIGSVGNFPSEILNALGLLGVGTALQIIAAAIGIRLLLQLIPFTRLGS